MSCLLSLTAFFSDRRRSNEKQSNLTGYELIAKGNQSRRFLRISIYIRCLSNVVDLTVLAYK